MRSTPAVLLALLVWLGPPADAAPAPRLAIMTGFTKDPMGPLTLEVWQHGLGSKFDAAKLARDVKAAGASHLIFRTKWLDGFLLRHTQTTSFHSGRDFVREIAAACQREKLPLVLAAAQNVDGNREFRPLGVRDGHGWFILFSEKWPFERHSFHSPYRKVAQEQLRELLTGYGRIAGLRLGAIGEPTAARSASVAQAYEQMLGGRLAKATAAELQRFEALTIAGYLKEVRALAAKHQPGCTLTACGVAERLVGGGPWARHVGPQADVLAQHAKSANEINALALLASLSPQPLEIAIPMSKSLFTPNEDAPPPARVTPKGAVAEAALALCRGVSVALVLTPGHDGSFGADLEAARAVGSWFRKVEPLLKDATPYADAAIILGSPASDGPGLPRANPFWGKGAVKDKGALAGAAAIANGLADAGLLPAYVCTGGPRGGWPPLAKFRALFLPELAVLDAAHAAKLKAYVEGGGTLVAFGHASVLDAQGNARRRTLLGSALRPYALADVFGATHDGTVKFPAKAADLTVAADSVWGSNSYPPANAVEGKKSFWASAEKPMPHWIQFNFPDDVEVARIEIVNRQGFNICDFDIQVPDGKSWKTVKEVRNAKSPTIVAALDKPVQADKLRVFITRETVGGKDRIIADVEEVRVVDSAGVNRAVHGPPRYPFAIKDAALAKAMGGRGIAVTPAAVAVKPRGAEVLATLAVRRAPPALLRHRFGKGQAILVAAPEGAFGAASPLWAALAGLLGGPPTVTCSDPARYRAVLARAASGHVLHVIDQQANGPGSPPGEVTVSVLAERVGNATRALRLAQDKALVTKQVEGRLVFTLRPDPVESVVLK